MVVVSIPLRANGDVPAKPLANRPVMDTNNYYPQRDGKSRDGQRRVQRQ